MKKLLAILFLIIAVQGIAETVVKGTYEAKRKRYVELTQTLEKEIFLNYTLPDNKKEIVTYRDDDYDILLIENNKAVVYDRKNEKEINYLIKVKYSNAIYYDNGGGSLYNGYKFYKDKEWTEPVLKFNIITKFGIALHHSLGDNPYNRELTEKEKERIEKYDEKFNEEKELYQRAMQTPDVTQSFSY